MQAWQHAEDMKKKIVSNAMCSWAEAVALSAGEEIDFDRTSCSLATVEAFVQLRQVLRHFLNFTSHRYVCFCNRELADRCNSLLHAAWHPCKFLAACGDSDNLMMITVITNNKQ